MMAAIQEYQQLIYAVLMIAIMLWLPNGLLSLRWPARADGADLARLEGREARP